MASDLYFSTCFFRRQYENRKDVYITNFWGSVDWARVSIRYAEASGDVVPEALPSPERQVFAEM